MGQVRHGSATTTHAVRAAIQRSQASLAQLSRELGINPKTVAKWRKRASVEDMKTGPKEPRSTVLTEDEDGDEPSRRERLNHLRLAQTLFRDAGDTLMILEAMKMRNRIKAPMDGKVKVVRVAVGEKVTKGQVLIEIA